MKPDEFQDLIPEEFFEEEVGSQILSNEFNKNMNKNWWESRTLWLAIGQAVAGVLLVVFSENQGVVDIGWVSIVKSFLDGYLRVTTK